MTIRQSFITALTGLKTNRGRSLLTILGIVIGITAIILMMSIGRGAEKLILNEISGLGAETIVIRPGQEPTGPADSADMLFLDSLKQADVAALQKKSNVPHLVDIMPFVIVPGSVAYESETFRPTIIGGAAHFWAEAFALYPEAGELFSDDAERQRASVVVIGAKVKRELFGASDALGKYVKIKERKFRVVGIFPPRGQVAFMNVDELVLLPVTTAQTYLLGTSHFHEIIVKASDAASVPRTVRDIEATLRAQHNITDPEKDDFFVVTQQGLVDQIRVIIGALTAFLSSVVAIALVVGGVGVMNIMLVSVTERTKEIGLRKAIGATEGNILTQFLLESVILTAIGGVVGILLGILLSLLAAVVLTTVVGLDWAFSFPIDAAVLGIVVSSLVGLIFGIYPARQAARKHPIEALRYE